MVLSPSASVLSYLYYYYYTTKGYQPFIATSFLQGMVNLVIVVDVFSGVGSRQDVHSSARFVMSPFLPEEFSLTGKKPNM